MRTLLFGSIMALSCVAGASPSGWAAITSPPPSRYRLVVAALQAIGQWPTTAAFGVVALSLFTVGARQYQARRRWKANRSPVHPNYEKRKTHECV